MTRAAAWLAGARNRRPRAIDMMAHALIAAGKPQEAVLMAARFDMAIAQMASFDGKTSADLQRFFAEREQFCETVVRMHAKATDSKLLTQVPVGITREG